LAGTPVAQMADMEARALVTAFDLPPLLPSEKEEEEELLVSATDAAETLTSLHMAAPTTSSGKSTKQHEQRQADIMHKLIVKGLMWSFSQSEAALASNRGGWVDAALTPLIRIVPPETAQLVMAELEELQAAEQEVNGQRVPLIPPTCPLFDEALDDAMQLETQPRASHRRPSVAKGGGRGDAKGAKVTKRAKGAKAAKPKKSGAPRPAGARQMPKRGQKPQYNEEDDDNEDDEDDEDDEDEDGEDDEAAEEDAMEVDADEDELSQQRHAAPRGGPNPNPPRRGSGAAARAPRAAVASTQEEEEEEEEEAWNGAGVDDDDEEEESGVPASLLQDEDDDDEDDDDEEEEEQEEEEEEEEDEDESGYPAGTEEDLRPAKRKPFSFYDQPQPEEDDDEEEDDEDEDEDEDRGAQASQMSETPAVIPSYAHARAPRRRAV